MPILRLKQFRRMWTIEEGHLCCETLRTQSRIYQKSIQSIREAEGSSMLSQDSSNGLIAISVRSVVVSCCKLSGMRVGAVPPMYT
jgi:hypothetical protein